MSDLQNLPHRPAIVIARRYGQLGNRLFLYAHMVGAACEYNARVVNPCFVEYANLFESTKNDLWCRFPAVAEAKPPSEFARRALHRATYLSTRALWICGLRNRPWKIIRLRENEQCDLAGEAFRSAVKDGRNILAQGWLFRGEELLNKHASEIRKHFRIASDHQEGVSAVINQVRKSADIIVGVHIRHGDYKTFLGGKYFYPVSLYAELMHRIQNQLQGRRVAFLVCSNAQIQPGDFDGLEVHSGPGHMIEDMYSLAECDLLIGPPSTFTGWASFYGGVPLSVIESKDHDLDATTLLQLKGSANAA